MTRTATRRHPARRPPRVGLVSLGCPKALVDSERVVTELRAEGYLIAPDYRHSDLVIINTCAFINEAVAESLEAIAEALRENGRVIVTGCLAARRDGQGESWLAARVPALLGISAPGDTAATLALVHRHLPPPHEPFADLVPAAGIRLTPRHYAYLKISEGCSRRCSFCIIPQLRGPLLSRPPGEILREAENLVRGGARELLLVSQDTAAYGLDARYRYGFAGGRPIRTRLTDLLRELARLGAWVRLHYLYPYPALDEVVDMMAAGLVLPYLDVPLQHASPRVLRAMRRPAAGERALERIASWRRSCPELALRSTFITGFPGETEAEFEELLDFLRAARLDRVGCFAYSPVDEAAANLLPGQLPEEVREERRGRLMATQAEISAERLRARVGRRELVLIDQVDGTDGPAIGRSRLEAPEVDGVIRLEPSNRPLAAGDLVTALITGSDEHDLRGRVCGDGTG